MRVADIRFKPAFRKAVFVTYDSPHPSKSEGLGILELLVESWTSEHANSLLENIKSSIQKDCDVRFESNESFRIRDEGITTVLDFPRIYCNNGINFDQRLCIAICEKDKSTKIWSRIHLHFNKRNSDYPSFTSNELNTFNEIHKKIVEDSCKWAYDYFKIGLKKFSNKFKISILGTLNVFALGVNDTNIQNFQAKMENSKNTFDLISESKDVTKYFKYWNNFFGNDFYSAENLSLSDEHFWFSSPIKVLNNDIIENRTLLYFSKLTNKNNSSSVDLCGIGFDDLSTDYLTFRSSHRVSRLFGNKI